MKIDISGITFEDVKNLTLEITKKKKTYRARLRDKNGTLTASLRNLAVRDSIPVETQQEDTPQNLLWEINLMLNENK